MAASGPLGGVRQQQRGRLSLLSSAARSAPPRRISVASVTQSARARFLSYWASEAIKSAQCGLIWLEILWGDLLMSTSESSNTTGSLASRIVTATCILAIPVGMLVCVALQATGGDAMLALKALAGAGAIFLAVGLVGYAIAVVWRLVLRGPIMALLGFVGGLVGALVVGLIPVAIVGLVYYLLPTLAGQVFLGIVVAAVVLVFLGAFGRAAS
jgi:hypothetical protein